MPIGGRHGWKRRLVDPGRIFDVTRKTANPIRDQIMIVLQSIIIILFVALLVRGFLARNMPRVGGRLGRIRATDPPQARLHGFSRIYSRAVTLFVASDASRFPTLKAFLREGTAQQPVAMRIYRVAGCKAEIEIPDEIADYQRIDAAEALALLRELPDPRRVRRLHLSDRASFLDPWMRKVRGDDFYHLGHATNFSLIVLYRPDRRLGQSLGSTLLHEWLHLVAFASTVQLWRFKRANAIEPLPPLAFEPLNFGDRNTGNYEAWCDLGEKLLGYDENAARHTALASPVHAIILWRCVERMLRKTPLRLRSTRFDELMTRADFMRAEVEPKARAATARQPPRATSA
jgi:hypothetical protein